MNKAITNQTSNRKVGIKSHGQGVLGTSWLARGVMWVAALVVALHPGSLLFLLLDGEVSLDLLLLLEVLVESLLGLLQLLLQLFLLSGVGLGLAELLEIAFDLLILVVYELCDLLEGQSGVFAGIVVFVALGGLHDFQVLGGHLRNDVNHLRLRMCGTEYAPTPSSLTIDLSRALVGSFGGVYLSEADDGGLFDSVHRYVSYGAKFCQLTVDVLAYLLADGDLCSGVLGCLYGQVLDVDRESPVLYLGSAELWHLNVGRGA